MGIKLRVENHLLTKKLKQRTVNVIQQEVTAIQLEVIVIQLVATVIQLVATVIQKVVILFQLKIIIKMKNNKLLFKKISLHHQTMRNNDFYYHKTCNKS